MSGPTKKYRRNINFLVEEPYWIALDVFAERKNVRRSDVMREIVRHWYENAGMDVDTEVQSAVLEADIGVGERAAA